MDLSSAFVSFAEATYGHPGNSKWDKLKVLAALRTKVMASKPPEREELNNKLLSMIDKTKNELNMSRWVHMPKDSEEYLYYKTLCGNYEAFFNDDLGAILKRAGNPIAITHFKKARAICNLLGMTETAKRLDCKISLYSSAVEAAANNDSEATAKMTNTMLPTFRNDYEHNLNTIGVNSLDTILSGWNYARALRFACHCIEAERLLTKLATISRSVLGPHHKLTIEVDEYLENCKLRQVLSFPDKHTFHALRYENNGDICVIQGPIFEPRNMEDERIYHVAKNLMMPNKGCVVICCGLVSASYLNGELGDVRDWKYDSATKGVRLAVHFQKNKGVKSALVKPENVRIAFELPSKDQPYDPMNKLKKMIIPSNNRIHTRWKLTNQKTPLEDAIKIFRRHRANDIGLHYYSVISHNEERYGWSSKILRPFLRQKQQCHC